MAKHKYSASVEDYLEAISNIVSEKQAVRAKDIAKRLKVSNASVTGALHQLAQKKLINYAPYDVITLTPLGQKSAQKVIRRHKALEHFFVSILGIEKAQAEKEACKVEHTISNKVLNRLQHFLEYSCKEKSLMSKCISEFKKRY